MQNISLNFELPPQIPVYICMSKLIRLRERKRTQGKGLYQVQALRIQHSGKKETEKTFGIRCCIISFYCLFNYNMDFSALTNSIQMSQINQVSITLFDRYSFTTTKKIDEQASKKLLDNMFYALASFNNKFHLSDRQKNVSYEGSIRQLSELMLQQIEHEKIYPMGRNLAIEIGNFGFNDYNTDELIEKFPFIKSYIKGDMTKSMHMLLLDCLHKICQQYKKENSGKDLITLERNFKRFIEAWPSKNNLGIIEDKFKLESANLNSDITEFKTKMATYFPIKINQSLEEVSDTIERKLKIFYKSLDTISKDIRSVSHHSNFSKLKNEFELMQNALDKIKNDIYSPTDLNELQQPRSSGGNRVSFENTNGEANNRETVPFFSFYRVKCVSKHKKIVKGSNRNLKNASMKSIKTFEYGVSEIGSSESLSYHICDQEGNTFSQMEALSDDKSSRVSRVSPNHLISEETMMKKNQSMNQFENNVDFNHKFCKTINYDEITEKKKNLKEATVFRKNDFKPKQLNINGLQMKKNFEKLGINLSEYIHKAGPESKTYNEQQLEQNIFYFADLDERFDIKLHRSMSSIDQAKPNSSKVIHVNSKSIVSMGNYELDELKQMHSESQDQIQEFTIKYSVLQSQLESKTKSQITNRNPQLLNNMFTYFHDYLKPTISMLRNEVHSILHESQKLSVYKSLMISLKNISKENHHKDIEIASLKDTLDIINDKVIRLKEQNIQNMNANTFHSDRQKKLKARLERLQSQIENCASNLINQVNSKIPSMLKVVRRLKTDITIANLRKLDNSKVVQNLEMDNNDLNYINGNLLKELQILSINQQLLNNEKEQLEEQIKQKEELEEKIREMSITIKLLEEKLEMSNSLREMAEQKFIGMEESESPFEKYTKISNEAYNTDFNFNRQLGTIDENEELIEISETQEQTPIHRDTNAPSITEDRFKSLEQPPAKNIKLEIMKAYSIQFVISTNKPISGPVRSHLSKSFSVEYNKNSDIDDKNFKIFIYQGTDNKNDDYIENQNNEENESVDRFRQNKNANDDNKLGQIAFERRSSAKKSLFSMENVLKSIGEINKTELGSSSRKPIEEFNTNDGQIIPRLKKFSNSLYGPDELQVSQKFSEDCSPRGKLFSQSMFKFDKKTSLDKYRKYYERFHNIFTSLMNKYDQLNMSTVQSKNQLESKIKTLQEKLINAQTLQIIRNDILSQPNEDALMRSTILNSNNNEEHISLTERMKIINDYHDPNKTIAMKLFENNTSPQATNIAETKLPIGSNPNMKSYINRNEFNKFQENYDSTAVKNKSSDQIDDDFSSDVYIVRTQQITVSPINITDGLTTEKFNGDAENNLDQFIRKSCKESDLEIDCSDKSSNLLNKSLGTLRSSRNLESVVFVNGMPGHSVSEKNNNQVHVEDAYATRELLNTQNNTEFELVEKEHYRMLIETKDRFEAKCKDFTKKYEDETLSIMKELNSVKIINDSLKIESVKLYDDNQQLHSTMYEYKTFFNKAFEIARTLVDDYPENETSFIPEHLEKILEIVKNKFDGFHTIIEAMDEEIKMLKTELFPSENQHTDNYGGSINSIEPNNFLSNQPQDNKEAQYNLCKGSSMDVQPLEPQIIQFNDDDAKHDSCSNENRNFAADKRNHNSQQVLLKRQEPHMKNALSYSDNLEPQPEPIKKSNKRNELIHIESNASQEYIKENSSASHEIKNESSRNQLPENDDCLIYDETDENELSTSFSRKQKILKDGFYELLNNITLVIDENTNYLSQIQIRVTTTNLEPQMEENGSNSELTQADLQLKSVHIINKDFDLLTNNNFQLKEMVEFLTKNLIMFLEELEQLKVEPKSGPKNPQIDELLQENEFLYKKLNEARREIEALNKMITEINEKYPETVNLANRSLHRSLSLPAIKIEEETEDQEMLHTTLTRQKERLNELLQFKNQGYRMPSNEELFDQMRSFNVENEQKSRTRIITEKASFMEEPNNQPADNEKDENTNDQIANNLEEYNIFLLNILRQIKLLIDETGLSYEARIMRLEEISKDLDIM